MFYYGRVSTHLPAQCCRSILVSLCPVPKHYAHFLPTSLPTGSDWASVWRDQVLEEQVWTHCSSHNWPRKIQMWKPKHYTRQKPGCGFGVSYVLGNLIFFRFSSAFSSPMPTWQPKAKRVLGRSRWINWMDRWMHKQWTLDIWYSTDTHFKVSPDIWRL